VSTDLKNLEILEKSWKSLSLEKSGNFVKLDQKSGNFSRKLMSERNMNCAADKILVREFPDFVREKSGNFFGAIV